MLPHPDGLMLPIFFSQKNANELETQVGDDATVIMFQSPQELLCFVEHPPHSSNNELPAFEVLVDSVCPEGRQFGMIRRQNVIGHLKSILSRQAIWQLNLSVNTTIRLRSSSRPANWLRMPIM